VLRNAVTWFADRGITVERVLSDNGSAYRSHAWHDACTELAITPKRTRPYRPQTNCEGGGASSGGLTHRPTGRSVPCCRTVDRPKKHVCRQRRARAG
jgi:hypothetical protein